MGEEGDVDEASARASARRIRCTYYNTVRSRAVQLLTLISLPDALRRMISCIKLSYQKKFCYGELNEGTLPVHSTLFEVRSPQMLSKLRSTYTKLLPSLRYISIQSTTEYFDPHCDPKNPKNLELSEITDAYKRIKGSVIHTSCRKSRYFSKMAGCSVLFKAENKQRTGSFKERGARNALLRLSEDERKKGVVVGSNGNYAEAMAWHGKQLGVPVTVVMPRYAALSTISVCKDLGSNVVVEGKDHAEARRIAFKIAQENGGKFIDGHDHVDVIAGAGTIALEILEEVKDVDAILVPVGGAGLLGGISVAVKQTSPKTKVIGLESEASPSFSAALKAGQPVTIKIQPSLAASLAVSRVGYNSFNIAKGNVDEIVTVKELDLSIAILRMLEKEKMLVDGAGAMGPAALLAGGVQGLPGKKIVCVLSGGNIDSTVVGRSIEKGLIADDRLVMFDVLIANRSGSISEVIEIANNTGGCIKDIALEHVFHKFGMFDVKCRIIMETRGIDHSYQLKNVLLERYGKNCEFFMKREKI
ncbi:hypothetical protein RB195_013861 [Necator americanus]|uniref:L-serine deaminase n=1 Tax=Necator americanus TaxID=51031 RepID=A0ABR1DY32_NECAM